MPATFGSRSWACRAIRTSSFLHLLSNLLIFGGFVLISLAWDQLHRAQQAGTLATTGPYAVIRHPQYLGFIVILVGFLLQWPTLLTLLMFPVLVVMYVRLARREEQEAAGYLRRSVAGLCGSNTGVAATFSASARREARHG